MTKMTPREMAQTIGQGLLTFPVTHFDAEHRFAEAPFREHCAWMLDFDVAALFAAGGTGEFFSLTPAEVDKVVRAAVEETAGRVPVIAGAGYGTAMAIELAQAAERAGADGILLLPPYLMGAKQEGLAAHIEAVCKSVSIGVIQYNRANAVIHEDELAKLADRCPNLVGFKDGVGDLELMMKVYAKLGDRLTYVGGLPTAETFAMPYLEMGVTTYSSAIYNFMPEWAVDFYKAVRAKDQPTVVKMLNDFVFPYLKIRDKGRGYAVSIVKAGLTAIGRPAGPVRLPLTDLSEAEQAELSALIAKANAPYAQARRAA
ncbi:5-dehydro-4-deoxyglucarate dehydratase [Sphingomonas abietis]|uniref:Probable 5-dehydro-4-deoxyglucarate dehydratase n=1 Tax=Sphingomonas abietis TaxID=3012344 RepID=A0ABY7NGQ3_9SPHN|nr:5-dehydro-4-deoxyglucarate dehydratase [Sphingomonas abietis]WBO20727.1 5-dehydro-4-deoxyglucarate dehydratase [Sphingomonas abietis]